MKKFTTLLLVGLMVLGLAACGTQDEENQDVLNDTEIETQDAQLEALREEFLAKANEVIVDETSVTFTDASGRESVTIEINPENVMSLYASGTPLWYEAGGVVAATIGGTGVETYELQIGRDITTTDGVYVIATSSAGSKWSVEEIVAFDPGLIFCSTSMSGYSTIADACEAAGIPVIAMAYDDFSDYLMWFKVFCNLNGQPELWDTVALEVLDDVMDIIAQIPEDADAPQFASLFTGTSANLSGTLLGQMAVQLGAENLIDALNTDLSATRIDISLETLFDVNPEVIILQNSTMSSMEETLASFTDQPLWYELEAVKNDRVVSMDPYLFHYKANSRFAEAYYELAQVLYPDVEFTLN